MDNDKVISVLNDLIETSKDGEQGFKECAENVNNPELKQLFMSASAQCMEGVRELQNEVRRLGGDPEKTSSVVGSLHRVWLDVKAAFTGKDELAVLNECERGEDAAVESYRKALSNINLPSEVRSLIERQFQGVMQNHDRIRNLRNQYRRQAA